MAKNRVETIYEDGQIVAVNKPSGINVAIDGTGKINLLDFLQKQRKDKEKLKIVHDLDKDASGIVILAKNTDAQKKMAQYFENGQVRNIYLAFVAAAGLERTGIIDAPLGEDFKKKQKIYVDLKHGKDAQTKWQTLADFGSISLVAVRPVTDITHQIQVHMHYAGMPLAIDPLYGQGEPIMLSSFKYSYRLGKFAEEKPLIDRLTLCDYELIIENYPDDKELRLIAPLEKKFKATVKMLTKYNTSGIEAFVEEETFNRLVNAEALILEI
ncbi:MAG: pseudouridine synthase [Phycisphaerae bacterium]|nr:pseudouridine synthase [Phycisphaerae bacterium]